MDVITRLKGRPGKGIWLCGGANLASELFAHDLVDQLLLKLNPLVIGSGIPLFSSVIQPQALELTQSKTYDNGVIQLHYTAKRRNFTQRLQNDGITE